MYKVILGEWFLGWERSSYEIGYRLGYNLLNLGEGIGELVGDWVFLIVRLEV